MEEMVNVLVTSISNKVPFIEALRKSSHRMDNSIYIYGGDSEKLPIAKSFVDDFWHMPPIYNISPSVFIQYCKEKKISVIFPTRDGELSYFSNNLSLFEKNGIEIMVSKHSSLNQTRDKLTFYEYLNEKKYPVIKTFVELNRVCSSLVVVKEKYGSGSRGIHLRVTKNEAILVAKQMENPIFQPFIEGKEYSIDVYVDQNGASKGAIVRERIFVVNGESQITKTVLDSKLEKLGMELAEVLQLTGHIMFQVIVDSEGSPHIVECNPRFGGASTLSVAAGLESFKWFIAESNNECLDDYVFERSKKELTQVRYAKDMII